MTMDQQPPPLRATDRDRDAAAAIVQEAHSDGRLDFEELDERLERIYSSKTQLELRDATADLAVPDHGLPGHGGTASTLEIRAKHSAQKREGQWRVPSHIVATAEHSSVKLDFTQAVVRHPEILVEATAQHSAIVLLVPRGWSIDIDQVQTEHAVVKNKTVAPLPGMPHLRVTGRAVHAGITIRHPRRRRWYWPWISR